MYICKLYSKQKLCIATWRAAAAAAAAAAAGGSSSRGSSSISIHIVWFVSAAAPWEQQHRSSLQQHSIHDVINCSIFSFYGAFKRGFIYAPFDAIFRRKNGVVVWQRIESTYTINVADQAAAAAIAAVSTLLPCTLLVVAAVPLAAAQLVVQQLCCVSTCDYYIVLLYGAGFSSLYNRKERELVRLMVARLSQFVVVLSTAAAAAAPAPCPLTLLPLLPLLPLCPCCIVYSLSCWSRGTASDHNARLRETFYVGQQQQQHLATTATSAAASAVEQTASGTSSSFHFIPTRCRRSLTQSKARRGKNRVRFVQLLHLRWLHPRQSVLLCHALQQMYTRHTKPTQPHSPYIWSLLNIIQK